MCRLQLIFKRGWEEKENEIQDLCRKHHTIIIGWTEINKKLAKTVKKFAVSIRELEIFSVNLVDGRLSQILSSTQKLDHLHIFNSTIDNEAFEEDTTPCTVTAIKCLALIRSDWGFLDFIKNTQVRDLKISSTKYTTVNAISFKDFMEKQTYLNSLALSVQVGEFFIDMEKITQKNGQVPLRNLVVDFKFWGDDPATDEAFVSFLVTHKNTLQGLEISRKISEKVLECIVTKLKISTLIIDSVDLPSVPVFYRMNQNKYLTTLVIKCELNNLEAGKGLLQVYPSITKLVIEQWSEIIINEMIIFISNNCKNLQNFEIPLLTTDAPKVALLPSIKTFRTGFAGDANELQTFGVNNPSIENLLHELAINNSLLSYEVTNRIATILTNLRYLLFGHFSKPTTRILEMMARNSSNLQLLEVFDATEPNFRVHYYHRDADSQLFKNEPSMWKWSDLKIAEDDLYYDFHGDDNYNYLLDPIHSSLKLLMSQYCIIILK